MALVPAGSAERFVGIDGGRVRVLESTGASGSGRAPLVLIHGGGTDSAGTSWYDVYAALGGDRRVVGLDLPGFGGTEVAPVGAAPELADFVARGRRAAETSRAVVAGVPMGGAVALRWRLPAPVAGRGPGADRPTCDWFRSCATGSLQLAAWLAARLPDQLLVPLARLASTAGRGARSRRWCTTAPAAAGGGRRVRREAGRPRAGLGDARYNQASLVPGRCATTCCRVDRVTVPTRPPAGDRRRRWSIRRAPPGQPTDAGAPGGAGARVRALGPARVPDRFLAEVRRCLAGRGARLPARSAILGRHADAPATVALVTLGCARNEVDSEELAGRLAADGLRLVAEPADADVVLVNTCGFVEAAKKDSVDTLLAAADLKDDGRTRGRGRRRLPRRAVRRPSWPRRCRRPTPSSASTTTPTCRTGSARSSPASGTCPHARGTAARCCRSRLPTGRPRRSPGTRAACPTARPRPAAPGRCGTGSTDGADGAAQARVRLRPALHVLRHPGVPRRLRVPAAGRGAGRGPLAGRPRACASSSWSARTRPSYGKDLGDLRLLETAAARPGGRRRPRPGPGVLPAAGRDAARPGRRHDRPPRVAPYFDLSFQHAAPAVLRRMRRFGDPDPFLALVEQIRAAAPQAGIRSNVIVGFPGETEADLEQLHDFLVAARAGRRRRVRLLRRGRHRGGPARPKLTADGDRGPAHRHRGPGRGADQPARGGPGRRARRGPGRGGATAPSTAGPPTRAPRSTAPYACSTRRPVQSGQLPGRDGRGQRGCRPGGRGDGWNGEQRAAPAPRRRRAALDSSDAVPRVQPLERAQRADRVPHRAGPGLRLDAAGPSRRARLAAAAPPRVFALAILTDSLDGYLARSTTSSPSSASWPTRSPTRR